MTAPAIVPVSAAGAFGLEHLASVTGGTVVNPKTRAADSVEVSREDGPGVTGTAIQGGVNNELKEGDVIVIPAGTPHWFSKIDGEVTLMSLHLPRK